MECALSIAAIFDLDGTLQTGRIGMSLMRHHFLHRTKRLHAIRYLIVHLPIWWAFGLRLLRESTAREIWTRNLGWTVQGWTPEEAMSTFVWIADEYVMKRQRADIVKRLRDHQEAGHRVILLSGTPSPLLEVIGSRFGIEETVGTPLILFGGRYTGRSEPPACQGVNKVFRLEEHLHDTSPINWGESWSYADNHIDIPVLERVGNPVAVYPDEKLKVHARENGWEIISKK
jgi:HAD superfamily hydrolase (TIGR01490 family)